jgi:hypothetical protein
MSFFTFPAKKTLGFLPLIVLLCFGLSSHAQNVAEFDSVLVVANGNPLMYPWAGGFNNPQYSQIDFNKDGTKDLFIFDESTGRVMTFLNQGIADSLSYLYTPIYEKSFPRMNQWSILADYNNDGNADIFTFNKSFIRVYRNDYAKFGSLKFTKVADTVYYNIGPKAYPLLVNINAFPCIEDINGDGNIDIMTYIYRVSYYQNMSMRKYSNPDSLSFTEMTDCWGGFSANPTVFKIDVNLNTCSPDSISAPIKPSHDSTARIKPNPIVQHNGQAILALDLNGDGKIDALLGDIVQNTMDELLNSTNDTNALMTYQNDTVPSYDKACSLYTLDVPFYMDVDNDGLRDLLVTPYAANTSNDIQSCWYYKNTGTATIPHFHYIQDNFLQSKMIDVGEGAYPAFLDYDGDGLMDLVIGDYGHFNPPCPVAYEPTLSLYRNTGTISNPQFQLITNNFCNLDSIIYAKKILQSNNAAPTFGDLDSDGAVDMILGVGSDSLYYFHNTAPAGKPVNFVYTKAHFLDSINIRLTNDYGASTSPQLVDVNGDGKLDLLIGCLQGTIYYYENTGTRTNPNFTLRNANFGGINVSKKGFFTGYSMPMLYTYQGHHRLMVGTQDGELYVYDNIDSNLNGKFNLIDSTFGGIWKGGHSAPAMYDLHHDSMSDLIVGNYGGGVSYYKGVPPLAVNNITNTILPITFYPNPCDKEITLQMSHSNYNVTRSEIEIYDITGRRIFAENTSAFLQPALNTSLYADGMYICNVKTFIGNKLQEQASGKFIIHH